MKWVHRLIGLLIVAVALGISFVVLYPAFQGGAAWNDFIAGLADRRAHVIVVCIGIVLAVTVYVLTGFTGTPRASYLAYETEHGNISISLKALQEFLAHLKPEFPQLVALHPRVRVSDESLDITLEVRVRAGAPIPELCRMLQERARSLVQDKIGVAAIREVEIKVEEIVKDKDAPPTEMAPPPSRAGEVT